MDLDLLMKAVDLVLIAAIIGVIEGIKKFLPENQWRFIPLITLGLGFVAGWIMTPGTNVRAIVKSAIIYGGAASLAYELVRTTLLARGSNAEAKIEVPKV